MKKLFPEDKNKKKGIMEFLDKKGFYIVLLLCIGIVAATAIFVTTRNATSPDENYNAQNIIPEELDDNAAASALTGQKLVDNAAANTGQKSDVDKISDPKADAAQGETGASSISVAPAKSTTTKESPAKAASAPVAKQSFIMPVFGAITFDFAQDKLVYSKTLEEWRTHDGIDLAADRGTPVKAVADGVISEIKNDPRFGIIVIIDHNNGLKTVYANLAGDDMVAVNQIIKQGEIIGSVGNTAALELAEQSHLHFGVLKDNLSVNPSLYLPQSKAELN